MRCLTVSGSLRSNSSNTTLLRALPLEAPEHQFTFPPPLDSLPYFNPDIEEAGPPPTVESWRAAILVSDALVICSPEYAHGVPGVLKNALDWLVGGVEIVDKPIAVINTSLPSTVAHASLLDILSVMGGKVVPDASLAIALRGRKLDEVAMASDPIISPFLKAILRAWNGSVFSETLVAPPYAGGNCSSEECSFVVGRMFSGRRFSTIDAADMLRSPLSSFSSAEAKRGIL